ncbi:MAG: hypothetical protein DHS20C18_28730 [Saprospiraceae bacterium]|nr:MAG: hypothetical protein DHS20C18_28730 [Saprospiraceae bacterium]
MNEHCTINDKWTYNGMKVIFMENEFLKIGILADRGSDIFQYLYKPVGIDLMLRLDKEMINPREVFSQMRDTPNQFEDYYYGGWQEILPNSPAMNYRGASLGQHGEISFIPWNYAIVNQSKELVSVKLWTRPLRFPILIEKTLTLKRGSAQLQIDERLTNESDTYLHLMWGHHIAFGLPFLADGARIKTSATKFLAEPAMPDHRLFKPGKKQDWPMVQSMKDQLVDASKITKAENGQFSELAYLSDFEQRAFYAITTDVMTFSIHWDAAIFKSLWFWQERYATQDAPWWGKTYAIALEPWSSQWRPNPDRKTMDEEWLKLQPREVLETSLVTNCE